LQKYKEIEKRKEKREKRKEKNLITSKSKGDT